MGPEWAGSPALLPFGTMENHLACLPAPSWLSEPTFVGGGESFLQPTQPLATWAHILLDA